MTLSDLLPRLQLSRTRVAQWAQRGLVEFAAEVDRGTARSVTRTDAMRLLVLADLMDHGVRVGEIPTLARAIVTLSWVDDRRDYLVVSAGRLWTVVPPSLGGGEGTDFSAISRNTYIAGQMLAEYLEEDGLLQALAEPERYFSVVVSLAILQARVSAAWGD